MELPIFVYQKWRNTSNFMWFNPLVEYYKKTLEFGCPILLRISKNFYGKDRIPVLKGDTEAQTTVKDQTPKILETEILPGLFQPWDGT